MLRKIDQIKVSTPGQAILTYSLFQIFPSQSKVFHNYGKILKLEAHVASGLSDTTLVFEVVRKVEVNLWLCFLRTG